jgi:hypothetical protein
MITSRGVKALDHQPNDFEAPQFNMLERDYEPLPLTLTLRSGSFLPPKPKSILASKGLP